MAPGLNVVAADQDTPSPSPPPRADDVPPGSVLARLRERAAAQRRDRTLDVPIDAWDGQLVVRYRMPALEDADRFADQGVRFAAGDGPAPSLGGLSVDVIATCAVTVLGRREDGELEDLEARFTGKLLGLLGLALPPGVEDPGDVTAREVIEAVFFGSWMAVNVHAANVIEWLQGGSQPMGEASAAT